ncbi:MoaD/ThiS family protein [Aquimarina sp. 2201CG5-10]|uniref:MoaD/ThiS family protein n=1 Tax=Aquimarina callyspongiae TaxID=3098150 RepID=UPI002AB4EC60|nr:MoaD/ThiS family protein [Aquimarina sp. 2201CG5-10]MDY8138157.1 MoaD/ThiS family protein [Aquimarina sp. 2201CG5-10]
MELKVLYFGMIAEITNRNEELLLVIQDCDIFQLESLLKEKYESLKNVSFKIAVDQKISNTSIRLKPTNEIALLPPFSGG